jgi:C1A family cysteine protease
MSIKTFLCNLLGCNSTSVKLDEPISGMKYGWKPDLPDHRDIRFSLADTVAPDDLPSSVDLRTIGFMPIPYDQGKLGSCTANSIAAAIEFDRAKQKLEVWTPSRLFIYYHERLLEGTVNTDAGAMIRDGFKVINSTGFAKETTWPYIPSQFRVAPNAQAMAEAGNCKVVTYQAVDQTPHSIKAALASGYPICFGISVYSSFESRDVALSGRVPMPSFFDSSLGGHAILLVGYDEAKQLYTFRNSWGTGWGDKGYGYLPYQYVHSDKLASDFWIAETLSQ